MLKKYNFCPIKYVEPRVGKSGPRRSRRTERRRIYAYRSVYTGTAGL